jgi:hypothetical protein
MHSYCKNGDSISFTEIDKEPSNYSEAQSETPHY